MAISVFSMIETIMLARALFVAANLDIAEHLASKPMMVEEIATITRSDIHALDRLMFFLEMYDVFKKQNDQKYYLTDFSKSMRDSHPNTIRPFLLHDDETRWNSFGHLGYSIATGKAVFNKLYGVDYFEYLKQHSELNPRFNSAMAIISADEDTLIAKVIPFGKVVIDVGGGTGQLISKIADTNSIDQGILFDLPEVIEQAVGLHPACIKKAGSFFDPIPVNADIFILKRILHDWNDEEALKILTNISNAMHSDSKLYIIEGILDYSENKRLLAAIDLALLTVFQGKERTKSEFASLIERAGLTISSMRRLNDIICIIECKKTYKTKKNNVIIIR